MKLQINNKIRIALICILIILISSISFLLFQKINNPMTTDEKMPVYTYNNKVTTSYTVFLKANNLYEGNSLGEGSLYISEFVDYIRTTFDYEFSGEKGADIEGNYDIVAKVQGFVGDGENLRNIWEKQYTILNKKSFNIKDTSKTIKEEVILKLEPYNDFVEEIKEASKISSQTMLTLSMNINIKGSTDKGPIEDSISPSLIIPLSTPIFEISGENIIDKPGAIEKTVHIKTPLNTKQIILYGGIIGILVLLLILLIFFIKASPDKGPHVKLLRTLFKKYGDRLVALNNDLITEGKDTFYVKSVDDLVRIADEIGKPIMYKYNENYEEINIFYISFEDQTYLLDISEILVKC